MKEFDEPLYIDVVPGKIEDNSDQVESEIRELCSEQPFAVLATQDDGELYSSLISFAFSDNLAHLVFATPVQSRKFAMIIKNSSVSLLIDNRAQQPESINLIRALTITGKAKVLEEPDQIKRWSDLLIDKHQYLEKFIKSSTSSLILVDKILFNYVRRFQEVYQWAPVIR